MIRLFILSILAWAVTGSFISAADPKVIVLAGRGLPQDSVAFDFNLREPFGAEYDSQGNLWIIEMVLGNRLLRLSPDGKLTHMAGATKPGFDGDSELSAMNAVFNGPHNLAIHPDGRVFIADTWNGRVRQFDPRTNLVSTLPGFEASMDRARAAGPYCVTLNNSGNTLYIADLQRVQALYLDSGTLAIIAGNGQKGIPLDGSIATKSPLVDPRAVAADRLGNIYILERNGNALRVVNSEGKIRTVVNKSGAKGISDLVGPASLAKLNGPKHLCVDQENRVIIADAENNIIVRYDPLDSSLTRLAGTGQSGLGDTAGSPLNCQLARPHGVSIDPKTSELIITDSYNHRILKITN